MRKNSTNFAIFFFILAVIIHFYVTFDTISYAKNPNYNDDGIEKFEIRGYLSFIYIFLYFFSILMYCFGIYTEVTDINFKLKILGTTDKFPLKNAFKANVLLEKGIQDGKIKNYEEAMKNFNKALELNSDNEEIWINKANVLVHLRKYQEALRCYDIVLKLNPENQAAKTNKILVNEKINNMEKGGEKDKKKESLMELKVGIRGLDLDFPEEKTKNEKNNERTN